MTAYANFLELVTPNELQIWRVAWENGFFSRCTPSK